MPDIPNLNNDFLNEDESPEANTELFDKYLDGEMSEEEKKLFEKALQEDVDLKKHFVAYQEMLELGEAYFNDSDENILNTWRKQLPKKESMDLTNEVDEKTEKIWNQLLQSKTRFFNKKFKGDK